MENRLLVRIMRDKGPVAVYLIHVSPDLRKVIIKDGIIKADDVASNPPLNDNKVFSVHADIAPAFFKAMAQIYHEVYEGVPGFDYSKIDRDIKQIKP